MKKVCLKVLIPKEENLQNIQSKGNTTNLCGSKRYININDILEPKIELKDNCLQNLSDEKVRNLNENGYLHLNKQANFF